MQQKKYDVFISYSSKDYIDAYKKVKPDNVLSKIKAAFTEAGISYWFDEEGVYSGDEFAPVLAKAIKNSEIVLYVSSVNSNSSEWTRSEIAVAHSYKKKIIPFKIDDSIYDDSVIIYLATLDYIDYRANPDKAIQDLLEGVKTYLEKRKKEIEKNEAEERAQSERKKAEHARFQSELIASIKHGINDLDTEEMKADSHRRCLMTDLEMVDSSHERGYLSGLLNKTGILHTRYVKECNRLTSDVEFYKNEAHRYMRESENSPKISKNLRRLAFLILFFLATTICAIYMYFKLECDYSDLQAENRRKAEMILDCKDEIAFYNEKIPILLTDIEIGIIDKNSKVIIPHGAKLYSKDTRFFSPRVKMYVCARQDSDSLRIDVKLFKDNTLRTNSKSENGFTYDVDINLSRYEMHKSTPTTILGWGNDIPGHWSAGKYRFEFWVGDYCVGSKDFEVFE